MLPRKYMIHAFLIIVSLVIILAPHFTRKPDEERLTAASRAADQFLELIDSAQYQAGWKTAAAYLQQQMSLADWSAQLTQVHQATGAFVARELQDYDYTNAPKKDIPAGEYMIFHYASHFANKADVSETLTLMLEEDQIWRVAGYFID